MASSAGTPEASPDKNCRAVGRLVLGPDKNSTLGFECLVARLKDRAWGIVITIVNLFIFSLLAPGFSTIDQVLRGLSGVLSGFKEFQVKSFQQLFLTSAHRDRIYSTARTVFV